MYRINETFYSLQGEGYHVGKASFFIRFSGCNLACAFCDTDHRPFTWRSLDSLLDEAARCPASHVVLTGGEPTLSADAALVEGLHRLGKFVAIETNGTHEPPEGTDWVTLSPKDGMAAGARTKLTRCDELKVVYRGQDLAAYAHIEAGHRFLQPCDTGNPETDKRLRDEAIALCLKYPQWRLSLQTHKLTGIR